MLQHYATLVFRNILHHKVYTAIVVGGLAMAMTAYLLIAGYVDGQKSYDRTHTNGDRIFRVESLFSKNGVNSSF